MWQYTPSADAANWAQKWIVKRGASGSYSIISALHPGRVLEVKGASTKDKTNVQLGIKGSSSGQSFTFLSETPDVAPCENIIPAGAWFALRPTHAKSLAVDIKSASTSNGANVQLYASNGSLAQLFTFEYQKSGYYLIRNAASGKVLDVDNGDVVPGTNVHQWGTTSSDNRLFSAVKNADGTYTFINKATGLALDVRGAGTKNGTNLDAYTPNGTAAQKFSLSEKANLLSTGLYTIASAKKTSAVLDVKSGSGSSGANVQLYASNGSAAQKWYIAPVSGKTNTYTIEAVVSGKRLAVDANGNVCQRTAADTASQQWVPFISAGTYGFKSVAYPSKVLDVYGGSTKNGANVQVYASNGTSAQRFKLSATSAAVANGTYLVRMGKSASYVLDVKSGSLSNAANVQVYAGNNSGAQKWNFTRNSDGTYTIVNAQSGKALDVKSGKAADKTNVQQYTKNGSKAQKWRITYEGNGGYKIASAVNPAYVLDVSGGSARNGANVQIYRDNGTAAQRFTLKTTTYMPSDQAKMVRKAQGYKSSTRWLLLTDTTSCRVGVFKGSYGNWVLQKYWKCGPGKNSTPTVLGQYTVTGKGYSFGHGYTCYYYTQFYGDYLFHSVKYYQGTRRIMDGRLGQRVSAGCVRLDINNAYWLYKNIPYGTKVVNYK